MTTADFWATVPNMTEEGLCILITFLFLSKIRNGRKALFCFSFVFSTAWAILKSWLVASSPDGGGAWILAYHNVGLLLTFTFYGRSLEGGVFRTIYMIVFQDISISLVLVAVIFLNSRITGIPFSELFAHASTLSISLLVVHFLLYVALLLLVRRVVNATYAAAIETYPVMRVIAVTVMVLLASPYSFMLGVPGFGEWHTQHMILYLCLEAAFLLFAVYHIRMNQADRQTSILRKQNQTMREHLTVYRDQIALTRKLRHDIRRHLQVLKWGGRMTGVQLRIEMRAERRKK